VALAWLRSRPGVVSTIIGARTMEQLIDNIKSLNVSLTPEQIARLDEITRPTPIFPQSFLPGTCSVYQGGTTINGEASDPWPLAPRTDTERH
jgi:diketogulonate reductase-like aldo/keto reductase